MIYILQGMANSILNNNAKVLSNNVHLNSIRYYY